MEAMDHGYVAFASFKSHDSFRQQQKPNGLKLTITIDPPSIHQSIHLTVCVSLQKACYVPECRCCYLKTHYFKGIINNCRLKFSAKLLEWKWANLVNKQNNILCEKLLRNDNNGISDHCMPGARGTRTYQPQSLLWSRSQSHQVLMEEQSLAKPSVQMNSSRGICSFAGHRLSLHQPFLLANQEEMK